MPFCRSITTNAAMSSSFVIGIPVPVPRGARDCQPSSIHTVL
jgi:hypothetical protein